jgi:hypothetical protein
MRKTKIIVPIVLLLALVLIGAMCSSTKSFYKRACKVSVPFQEKIQDFYGLDGGSELGFYDDVDECVEESIEMEADMYEECMEEEDDEEECDEMVEDLREVIAEALTMDGCEDLYGGMQCAYYQKGNMDYDHCMDEIEELCEDLPEEF